MSTIKFAGYEGYVQVNKDEMDNMFENCYMLHEVFTHDEGDYLNFDYNYAVEIIDMDSACGEEGYTLVLYLTVHRDSLSEDAKKQILDDDDFEINPYDIISYGLGAIQVGYEHYKTMTSEEASEMAYKVLTLAKTIDGMRGFFLDLPINGFGDTGWSMIGEATGKDF